MCITAYKVKYNPQNFVQNAGKRFVFAPCGMCEDCANSSRYAWAWRLTSDLQYYVKEKGYKVGFITLTYNEDSLPRFPSRYPKLAGMPCFNKEHTNKLILYLRKTLFRDYGIKDFLYFLASERGEHTYRPHYHLMIAWNPSTGCTPAIMHERIKRYWSQDVEYKLKEPWGTSVQTRKALGFVTPRDLMGGERKRDGSRIMPFEVSCMENILNSAFYTAKYVIKDLYFMRDIENKVTDFERKSPDFKNYLPHHRQSKSLGFHGIASLSDAQKIELLLRGKSLLGSDKLSMPPLYIQNKLLFKPCYIIGRPCKAYPDGKRLVSREATQFYKDYFNLITDAKLKYYDTLFESMNDVQYWLSSGLEQSKAFEVASYIRFNDFRELFGCSISEAYLFYYGMEYNYCFTDKKLTMLNRFRHPAISYSSVLISRESWCNIQEFFGYLMSFCRWQKSTERVEEVDTTRQYWSQVVSA